MLTLGRLRYLHPTPLYRLINAVLREALEHDGRDRATLSQIEESLRRWTERRGMQEPARASLLDRTIYEVLFRLFRSDLRIWEGDDDGVAALAIRWLSGDYLDPEEAKRLGLASAAPLETPVALVDNQQVKQVLVALSRMALSRQQPFILCFDQVDNLDENQAAALFRFLEALIDSSPNLLVVTAGIQASLLRWRQNKVIQDSAWDRLAQFEVPLQRVTVPEGRGIVAARLKRVLDPLSGHAPARRLIRADPLFPLGQAWANDFFKDKIDLRPREVINAARAAWQREQESLALLGEEAWLAAWGGPLDSPAPKRLTAAEIESMIDGASSAASWGNSGAGSGKSRRRARPTPTTWLAWCLRASAMPLGGRRILRGGDRATASARSNQTSVRSRGAPATGQRGRGEEWIAVRDDSKCDLGGWHLAPAVAR